MKTVLGVALSISLLLNVFSTFRLLDMGITVTHQGDEIQYVTNQLAVIEKMFPALLADGSRARLLSAAKEAGLETFEKGDDAPPPLWGRGIAFADPAESPSSFDRLRMRLNLCGKKKKASC